ncbi:uncharacterized protein BDW43DRAFT_309048 [Aspergillus alliaceus]|uniref:uncharacterized protein n=1 Tax=Petromyces alliaceus TaxID=209559 RepID=UPI0012A6B3FE|nr:uncharacterized protein BDW43DRAFT_309048 [Aspergillus alliaceus]KAB8235714.1 hypothetical protein BDW43DRAFT_309048 [Aspergillus alliaceus]
MGNHLVLVLQGSSSELRFISLWAFRAKFVLQAMWHIESPSEVSIPPPDIYNECWNEPSEIRTGVLRQLKAICEEILGRDKFPPTFWAFCQVADITRLEEMINDVDSADSPRIGRLLLEPTIKDCDSIIDQWLQNISVRKSSNSGTSHSERSDRATRNCKKRDNYKCILTETPDPAAAHIYPNCLLKASTRQPRTVGRFWDIMNVFWDEGRVQRWKAEIFGNESSLQKPQHGCFNMLSLDKYAYIDNGEPVFKTIASGDVFTLITNNPETMPLPSQPSLEMQWYLQRIAGLSGAAEAEGNSGDNDDDAGTTALRNAAIQRTRSIYNWLGVFTYDDEGFTVQQPPIQVRQVMIHS